MSTLTICIPTYNRAAFLDECLASLCPQLTEGVELIVLDNASSDETATVVGKWRQATPLGIGYERHPENIGGNRNLDAAARRGKGRYIWVLGDDEVVLAGAVKRILSLVAQGVDFVILNHAIYDLKMEKPLVPYWFGLNEDRELKNCNEAMAYLGLSAGFISAIVTKREILTSPSPEEAEKYAKHGFNQVYAFYKGLSSGGSGVVTGEVVLHARGGNARGYDWSDFFVTGVGVVFSDLGRNCGYSRKSVRAALSNCIVRYHVGHLVESKFLKRSTRDIISKGFRHFSLCGRYWVVLIPLSVIPPFMFQLARRAKRRLKRAA